ncbi:hypothetical protein EOM86_13325 [Candidatus Nomurabacteria bacterium]|nr:hypothetical protein [Candidatus Nomurabacteria bacterium]
MAKFERCFPSELQEALKKPPLYTECLLRDICSGEVFPAFRNNKIDFYHKGGRLFEFDGNEFTTHVKYASVLHGYGKPYIKENLLDYGNVRLIRDFKEGYTRIKENCSLHSGLEASEVARIYTESSFSKEPLKIVASQKSDAIELKEEEKPHNQSFPKFDQNVVVLDIEVSLESLDRDCKDEIPDEGKKGKKETELDILDLLLFNKSERCLQFFEAKHYNHDYIQENKEGKHPELLAQLERYNKQIAERRKDILEAYRVYTRTARELFEKDLPDPEVLKEDVVLLIFGFDGEQKRRLDEMLLKSGNLNGVYYRSIGDISTQTAADVWNNIKLGE